MKKLGRFRSPTLIVEDREVHGTLIDQLDGSIYWMQSEKQLLIFYATEIIQALLIAKLGYMMNDWNYGMPVAYL